MYKKLLTAASAITILFTSACSFKERPSEITEKTFFVMDTAISFKGSKDDAEKAEEILLKLDKLFDRYSESSDIYAINQRSGKEISKDTKNIINSAIALSDKYVGDVSIFAGDITDCWDIESDNPRVPSDEEIRMALESFRNASFSQDDMSFADENGSIDLGSVAKGYAMDKLNEELGDDNFYIASASSSILLSGEKTNGKPFNVSIRDPETGGNLGILTTDACFISTSGGYERFFEADGKRYSHIFDLNTGYPAETDLTSVTVICGSGIESDFLATLIYIGGTERLSEFMNNDELKIIAVTENREIYLSDGINFNPDANLQYTIKELSDD